jgi:outer membrane receptor for ferric coprogen and ferric-rhodotorulic acid
MSKCSIFPLTPLASVMCSALLAAAMAPLTAGATPQGDFDDNGANEASLTLPAMNVHGKQLPQSGTEGTGSYTTGSMSTAVGLPLSIRETPQSVSVVTRQQIEDRGLRDTAAVLASAPGISMSRSDSNRVSFSARGFDIDNFQFDGLASPINNFWNFGATDIDSAIYDRVEVVRGSTGLLTGAGNPSAAVNFIRKRPLPEFAIGGSLGIGRWHQRRGDIDISTPLSADGRIAARVVAAYSERDTFIDHQSYDSETLYGVISAELNPSTQLTLSLEHQKNDTDGMGAGVPMFYADGSRTNFGRSTANNTKWSYFGTESNTAFVDLEHQLDNDWKLRAAYSRTEADYTMRYLFRGGYPDRDNAGMSASFLKYDGERTRDDWHLTSSGQFELLGRTHEAAFGWMSIDDDLQMDQYLPVPGTAPIADSRLDWTNGDIAEPVWSNVRANGDRTDIRQTGGYAVTRLSLADPLHLILGARVSTWKIEQNYFGTQRNYRYSDEVTPYAGLVYDLDQTYSLYTSYTSIFKNQTQRAPDGSFLEPVTGDSYEAGIKAGYLGGRLNAALSVYRTKQEGLAEAIPDTFLTADPSQQAYKSGEGAVVDGFDLELSGALSEVWNLSTSYTHFIARNAEGKAINTTHPRTQFKLFTTYRLDGALRDLTLGGGTTWRSGISRANTGSPNGPVDVSAGSYVLVDLMAKYQISEHITATANLNNAFDKKYLEQIGFYSQLWYGEPRNLQLTLSARF